jgi:catechol 2,3-dioxygenase-like lactoylglutathione lyase family enzyme
MDEPLVKWPFWIGVVTDHLERQRRFFAETLGLRQTDSGSGYVQFDLDGNLIEILARTEDPEYDAPRVQIGFEVTDIRDVRERLISRGVEPITDILGGPDSGNSWAYFRDPDGNVFEITERTS